MRKINGQDYSGGGVIHLNLTIVKQMKIPLPNLFIQKQIVTELEEKWISSNSYTKWKPKPNKKTT